MEDTILVMLQTATKSLFSESACKMYPLREPVLYERTRGRIEIDCSKCILCTVCQRRCPTGAIWVDKEKNTWRIDRFKCILCGNCLEGCKSGALQMATHYAGPVVRKETEEHNVTPPKVRRRERNEEPPDSAPP